MNLQILKQIYYNIKTISRKSNSIEKARTTEKTNFQNGCKNTNVHNNNNYHNDVEDSNPQYNFRYLYYTFISGSNHKEISIRSEYSRKKHYKS